MRERWDHENIPAIIEALNSAADLTPAPRLPPTGWPDERFDLILAFARRPGPGLSYSYTPVPQLLLAGDSPTPLA